MSKRKEKLKKIADQKGTEDYSAKGEYIKKGGLMGKGELYKNESVYVTVGGRSASKSTTDTHSNGRPVYANATAWYNNVLSDASLNPSYGKAKGFMFDGKIYSNPSGGGDAEIRKA